MKKIFAAVLVVSSALSYSAMAFEPCATKQRNAASFELAQTLGVPVQGASVVSFKQGLWTEMTGGNTGWAQVTVRAGNRVNRAITIETYVVRAMQIDDTSDCEITSVKVLE